MLTFSRIRRGTIALVSTLVVNAGIVFGLSASQGDLPDEEPARRVPVSLRRTPPEPPPPPPTPPPEPAKVSTPQAAPPLPRLALPAASAGSNPLALPEGEGGDFGWDLPVELPSYADGADALADSVSAEVEPAQLLFHPDLTNYYPRAAMRLRTEGRSEVRLELDARGNVTHAEVLESEPAGVFEKAALRAARRIRYRPARRAGRAHASTMTVVLEWRTDR